MSLGGAAVLPRRREGGFLKWSPGLSEPTATAHHPQEPTMHSIFDDICIALFILCCGLVAPAMALALIYGVF